MRGAPGKVDFPSASEPWQLMQRRAAYRVLPVSIGSPDCESGPRSGGVTGQPVSTRTAIGLIRTSDRRVNVMRGCIMPPPGARKNNFSPALSAILESEQQCGDCRLTEESDQRRARRD